MSNDNRRAIEVADRVLAAAEHADVLEIVADTLVTRGTALAIEGRPIEGLGAIRAGRDLADAQGYGATVVRADVNHVFVATLRDPRSGYEAAGTGIAYAQRLGIRQGMPILVGNLGETGLRTGAWAAVLDEMDRFLAQDWEASDRVQLMNSGSQIRALRGEDMESRLVEMRQLIGDDHDPQLRAIVENVAAYLAFVRGDLRAARSAWHRFVAYEVAQIPIAIPQAARAALWSGDAAAAREDLVTMEDRGIHGPAIEVSRRTIRAGLVALEGRPAEAHPLYRDALRSWRDLGLAWDEALCGLDMAQLLDPSEPQVKAAAESSREILVRLGAAPFIARLDAALARSAAPA